MNNKSDALANGRILLRTIALIVLIISVLVSLYFGFIIFLKWSVGNRTLVINDTNREEISKLIPQKMADLDNYTGLDDARSIDTTVRFDDKDIVVNYKDGNSCLFVSNYYADELPLLEYIEKNGYITYLHSRDFLFDLLKLSVPLIIGAGCVIFRKNLKRRTGLFKSTGLEKIKFGMPTLVEYDTFEENAALCRELGLDFIELNMNLPQFQMNSVNADRLIELSEKYGFFYTIHLDEDLNVCDFNDHVANAYLQTVKETIDLAKRLGIGILNMHLAKGVYFTLPDRKVYLFEKYKDVYLEKMRAFRDLCGEWIGDDDIKICIENCSGYLPFHKEAIEELLKSKVFALTYDIGHDHCTGGEDGEFILEHRDRLVHMHIHDAVNRTGARRDHLTLGEGELDIGGFLALEKELGCTVVIETKTSDALRRSVKFIKG